MKIFLVAAALAQAVGGSQASPANTPSAPAAQTANKWIAHTSDDRCWLIRGAEAPKGAVFAIHRIPGNETTAIWFVNPEWRRSPIFRPRKAEIALAKGAPIGEEVFFSEASPYLHGPLEQARIGFRTEDPGVLERLAEGGELRISEDGRELARTGLPTMKKALEALAACEDDALQSWGIDAAAWRRLRSRPRLITEAGDLVKNTDYPRSSIAEKAQGNVLIRLTIDAAGVPVDCLQILGTGNRKLDEKSCALIRQRARFHPAIDGEGNAVAAPYVTMISWRV